MTLANDAATSSAQGEMDLSSLLRLRIADFPSLCFCKDPIQPRVLHHEQHLCGSPQGTPLTNQLFLLSSRGVAAVAMDFCVAAIAAVAMDSCAAAVARDASAAAVARYASAATKCLPFRTCARSILLEAFKLPASMWARAREQSRLDPASISVVSNRVCSRGCRQSVDPIGIVCSAAC